MGNLKYGRDELTYETKTDSLSTGLRLSRGRREVEGWSGIQFPSPGDLHEPGMEPTSLMSPALADGFFTTSAT